MLSPLKASPPPINQQKVVFSPHLMEISLAIMDEVVLSIAQKHEIDLSEDMILSGIVAEIVPAETVFEVA